MPFNDLEIEAIGSFKIIPRRMIMHEKIVHDCHFSNKYIVTGFQSFFSVNVEPSPVIRTIPLNFHTQKVHRYFTNLLILPATERARGSIAYDNLKNNSMVSFQPTLL